MDSGDGASAFDAGVDAAPPTGLAGDAGEPAGGELTFPPVEDLSEPGPFETTGGFGNAEGPNCVVHRPATLGEGGLLHPVIVWGMGTGGFNTYQRTFELWASNGFIVVAGLSANGQGSGEEMLGCLEHVCTQYAPHVDCRAGATGHSQGGGGALMAGQDSRVVTTAPVQPYVEQGFGGFDQASFSRQTGPMLLLSGAGDTIASPAENQQPVFDETNVPVFWANARGVTHVGTGLDGAAAYREVVLAWFRLHLMYDDAYRSMFYGPNCELCQDDGWVVQRRGFE